MQKNTIEGFIEARNGAELKDEYDRFCYSLVTDHPSLGLEAKYDIITKYPDDWIDYYKASRYEKIDPAPQQGFKMIRPFTWEAAGQAPDVDSAGRQVLKKKLGKQGFLTESPLLSIGATAKRKALVRRHELILSDEPTKVVSR